MTDTLPSCGAPHAPRRRLAAVWFADIVGYTTLSAKNEGESLAVVVALQDVVRREVARFGGVVVKFLGDGAMARFESIGDAVASAISVRTHFDERMTEEGRSAQIRVGVHLGEIVTGEDGDIYGDGVNMAARVHGEAAPGTVVLSEDVARLLRSRPEFRLEPLGPRSLKGITDAILLFAVEADLALVTPAELAPDLREGSGAGTGPSDPGESRAPSSKNWKRAAFPVVAAVAAGLLATLGPGVFGWSGGGVVAEATASDMSIAVLPFEDLSSDPDGRWFGDGMTEDVLVQLSRIADFRVVSRASVMPFQGSTLSSGEIASQLGVGHLLHGSVRRAGDQLRISVQLVHAATDSHIWAESYDRTVADLFEIQSDIATRIARELAVRLAPVEETRIRDVPTHNVEAYEHYLRGRELLNRNTAEDNNLAIERLRRAVEADPGFARGYGILSRAMTLKAFNYGEGNEWADSAVTMAERALDLAPDEPEARASLGLAYLGRGWTRAGNRELEQVLELVPSHYVVTGNLGVAKILLGQVGEAVNLFRRGLALNPLAAMGVARTNLTDAYLILQEYELAESQVDLLLGEHPRQELALERELLLFLFRGEEDRARERARNLLERYPSDLRTLVVSGAALLFLGEVDEALPLLERAYREAPTMTAMGQRVSVFYATALAHSGEEEAARGVAAAVRSDLEAALARGAEDMMLYHNLVATTAILEGPEASLPLLEEAMRTHGGAVRVLELNPIHASVRDHPRFQRALELARQWEARERAKIER